MKANRGAAGVDHVTVEEFERHLEANLEEALADAAGGSYRPQAIRRVWIPKPGSKEKRPLGVPTVRDRVVQAALRAVLEPIFERDFAAQSYGFRPNRGCKDALRRVDSLLKAGYHWVVDADLKSYFDTIPHAATDGPGGGESGGWPGARTVGSIPHPKGDGDGGRMDARGGNAARRGDDGLNAKDNFQFERAIRYRQEGKGT